MLKATQITLNTVQVQDTALVIEATHYLDDNIAPKANLIYLHGGGLLYGTKEDLPQRHLETFTQAGLQIFAINYPLAPQAQIEEIISSIQQSIKHLQNQLHLELPYFLFGRSAGAYLALLTAVRLSQQIEIEKPQGVISYYGYGFLKDGWFDSPSPHYLKLPLVIENTVQSLIATPSQEADLNTHFSCYVYARQTGKWKSLIYQGRDKFFYLDYSLRLAELNLPIFAAHATNDPDVPFAEFQALCEKFNPTKFVIAAELHDFDRDEQSKDTEELIQATIKFIQST
ncbi:alpha/beta hydrolase [Mannheimia pernigra]|uniref:Alpha/beta hydrolase n=1 Tax=Mannheimia pernigra TaxID=111844 RepID=A0ABD7AAY5_9PAST|nr:alpha/beta hydrolase [Mannheimia pernigra]QLB42856.1 alpha/beta hydrolase [Mannheimia pernigra]